MKSYMITADAICAQQIKKHMPDYVLYRNKTDENYAENALKFINICSEFDHLKCFLHQDIELASKLGAYGVHLTSTQFEMIKSAKLRDLEVIISTHTFDEVKKAKDLGADAVTYSPIFYTPHKGEPKGVDELKKLVTSADIKIFALGGITAQEQIDKISKTGAYGFASIRYFC